MNVTVHHRIKILIQETNDAFGTYDGVNADYAEFATLALSEFKHVLRNPRLTGRQLTRMIRNGMHEHKAADPDSCWASFMAQYISQAANRGGSHSYAKFSWDQLAEESA
jgi:hypothetical protein